MPRQVGERFRCEDCGAEIVYTKACPCPPTDPEKHAEICCGKQMTALGVTAAPAKEKVPT